MTGLPARLVEVVLVVAGVGLPVLWVLHPQRAPWPLAVYGGVSLFTFGVYHHDKRCAREDRRRVPEATLQMLALCGGWPGALLAQQVLRHKTSKPRFQIVLWSIIALHGVVWGWWWIGRGNG